MKPVSELTWREVPVSELQAEIVERKTILSTLPPAIPGLLGWVGEPPTEAQLSQRAELEIEIAMLEGDVHRQTVLLPTFRAGMTHEREQRQVNAASKRNELNRKARAHCRNEASQLWEANDEVIRVGEMAQLLFDDLKVKGMYCPKSPDTVSG